MSRDVAIVLPPASGPPKTPQTCRHCRKPIAYAVAWTGYWYHPATQSTWCDNGGSLRAQP